jgi:sortase A
MDIQDRQLFRQLWKKRIIIFFAVLIVGFILINSSYLPTLFNYQFGGQTQIYTTLNYEQIHKNDIGVPNFLEIESLGIRAPVKFGTSTLESDFQRLLNDGVVHYPRTALAGEKGNVYIFGHSSDLIISKGNYKNIFATLPQIKIGSIIKLSNDQGQIFQYKVYETKIVNPSDVSVLSQGGYEKKLLTIQTSYPIGTALQRFVVICELVE